MAERSIVIKDDPRLAEGESVRFELALAAGRRSDPDDPEDFVAGWIFTDRRILCISGLGGGVLDEIAWNNIAAIVDCDDSTLLLLRRIEQLSEGSFSLSVGQQGDAVRKLLEQYAWCEVNP